MIVKDEEHNLPDCLAGLKDIADEVIVVDTGSSDRTRGVAKTLGARVFEFAWVDSFAAARNESLRHAAGDWVFWVDADDRIDGENLAKLKSLFAGLKDENAAFVMKCVCVPDAPGGTATVVDHVRLFRNDPRLRWRYRVHEQILPALRQAGADVRWADVKIRHVGYADPALRGRKLERDLRLLRMEQREQPDDPFTLFNLGSVQSELGRYDEALPLLERSLQLSGPRDSIVRKLHALIVQCLRQLGRPGEALQRCRRGREGYPADAELLFTEARLLQNAGRLDEAQSRWEELIDSEEGDHFASVDTGLRGHKARHNLAGLLAAKGERHKAEAQWRGALVERPDFLPAWVGLGELYVEHGDWPALERVAAQIEQDPLSARAEAAALRARGLVERGEFEAARQLLTRAIAEHPRSLTLRVLLSQVFLREGVWGLAEQALRDVLTLAPGHAQARHNLAVLLEQSERGIEEATPATGSPEGIDPSRSDSSGC